MVGWRGTRGEDQGPLALGRAREQEETVRWRAQRCSDPAGKNRCALRKEWVGRGVGGQLSKAPGAAEMGHRGPFG